MRRQKKCHYCHQWYQPHPQTYRQQKACGEPLCRTQRHRQADRTWHQHNPTYDDHREAELKKWRQAHPGYWKQYRKEHPVYTKRNRAYQQQRDRYRRHLAKQDAWNGVHLEKIRRIERLGVLAKQDAWRVPVTRQTEEICRYLKWAIPACKTGRDRQPIEP